jgi:ribosomal protein S18 acetylase RimI-like enzyme
MENSMTVREIRIMPMPEEQVDVAAAVMARAFYDDPLFVAGFPDPDERAHVTPALAAWNFRHGVLFGTVLVTADLAGTTITFRADEPIYSEARVAASIGPLRDQLGSAAWTRYGRMSEIWEAANMHLSQAVPEPHWYLDMVAVDPGRQGCGIGSALLRAVHEMADADGWATALLTFQPRNICLYERLGYERVGAGPDPVSGLNYWCFRRAPLVQRV